MTTPGPKDRGTLRPDTSSVERTDPSVGFHRDDGEASDPGTAGTGPSTSPVTGAERFGLRVASGLIAVMLLALLFDVWAGPRSAFRYGELRAEAAQAREELAQLERETSRAVFALRALQRDPKAYERLLAEEFGVAPEGAEVISFDDTDE